MRRVVPAPRAKEPATRAGTAPYGAQRMLDLQRTVGNRALVGLLAAAQPRLTVGAADDPYERQADEVADEVVELLRSGAPGGAEGPGSPGSPGSASERTGRHARRSILGRLQRRPDPLAVEVTEIGWGGGDLGAGSEAQVGALVGEGSALPAGVRRSMEGAFGADFGDVHLHRGPESEALNRTMGAEAFTVGRDVFLGADAPPLEHPSGQHLLAHELAHTLQQGASRPLAQRKVGFEFEDAHWRVWKKQAAAPGPGETVSPVARKDKVHNGTGFALEADDTLGATQPSLEFVTVPFDENAGGQTALRNALDEIGDIVVGRLGPKKGKPGPPAGGGFPKPYTATDYVVPTDHHLNGGDFAAGDVLFSAGDSAGKFKMQATMSTDMPQMSKAMTYFGSQVQGESRGSEERRKPARRLMSGNDAPTDVPSKVLGNSPRLGAAVVAEIQRVFRAAGSPLLEHVEGDTSAMAAFFAFVMLYVKMLQLPVDGVLKYRIPFLARRSFVTMFRALPRAQQTVLSGDDGSVMKDAVIAVSNANPLIARTQGQMPDTGLTLGTPLVNALKSPPQGGGAVPAVRMPVHDRLSGITIGIWLTEITKGDDLLSPSDCDQWLQANAAGLGNQERTEAVDLLESFASLDENPPPGGPLPPAVFENRAIAPNLSRMGGAELNFYEVADMARQYLQFFVNLAARPTRPGRFPQKQT